MAKERCDRYDSTREMQDRLRAVLLGMAFSVMATMLVIHALSTPGAWMGPNGLMQLTAALNVAYDQLLTARSGHGGANPRLTRLVALLNHSHLVTGAVTTLALAGSAPPGRVADAVAALGDSIGATDVNKPTHEPLSMHDPVLPAIPSE